MKVLIIIKINLDH